MAGTSRDISIVMTSAANNYNTRLDSSVRIKTRILIIQPNYKGERNFFLSLSALLAMKTTEKG